MKPTSLPWRRLVSPAHPRRLVCLLLLAGASCTLARAALPPTGDSAARPGAIAGEVTDARNGVPLAGAEIRIGDRLATSASDGSFLVRNLPPGDHEAIASYLGYQLARTRVTVAPGARTTTSFSLRADTDVVMLEAFTVSTELDSETRSKNRERNASSLTRIISSDALGSLPDTQVADSLRRLPGIATIRTRGEGETIVIRGADPSLNSINLDGVAIQSNADDGLTVSLNTFLVEQLASITVVKSLTPDLPADSIGGYVNLETKSPLDFRQPVLSLHANVDSNTTRREYSPRAGVSYLTPFGRARQFGLSVTASFQERLAEAWRIEHGNWTLIPGPLVAPSGTYSRIYIPQTIETRTNRNDRKRYGVSLGFDWNARPGTRLFARVNYDLQKEYEPGERQRLVPAATAQAHFNLARPFVVVGQNVVEATTLNRTTATAERSITSLYRDTASTIFKAGGRTDTDAWRIDYSIGYSRTLTDVDQVFATFVRPNVDYHYFRTAADRPFLRPVTAIDLNDPAIYPLNQLNVVDNTKDYDLVEAKLDGAYTTTLLGRSVTLKAGASGSRSKKVRDDTPRNSISGTPLRAGPLLLSDSRLTLRRLPDNFLGAYDLGVGPEGRSTHTFARSLFREGAINFPASTNDIANDYTIEQKISTGYALANVPLGPTANILGVRFERTVDDGVAFALGSGTGTGVSRIYNHRSYDFLAPSLNTRLRFGDRWQARFGYTETMRRPGYDTAAPRTTYSIAASGAISATTFNPDLKQQVSRNADLSLEYYFSKTNRVGVGVFAKRIEDTLFRQVTTPFLRDAPAEVQALFPPATSRNEIINLIQQANGGDAEIRGAEVEFLYRISSGPALLRGLAFTANFTSIESEWTRVLNSGATATTRFPLQSRTTGNLALDYTRGRWFGRLSYNWRGNYLNTVNNNDRDLDQWGGNAESIDFRVSYRFHPNWLIQLQALNVKADADTIWLGTGLTRLRQYERSGAEYSLGVNWRK